MAAELNAQYNIDEARSDLARNIPRVDRTARGSLRDELVMVPGWDSAEVSQSIADDFGSIL